MKLNPTSILLSLALVSVLGCGGATTGSATGQMTMHITWPDRSRLIPVAANSINVSLTKGITTVASHTVARPTVGNQTDVVFSGLASGTYAATAQAFPNANGTGIAQASATQNIVIGTSGVTPLTITMASTIDTITVSPLVATVAAGSTLALSTTALDIGGATVLTSPSTLQWLSSNTAKATVDQNGVVTGVAAGTTIISVTDSESGVTGNRTVTVN